MKKYILGCFIIVIVVSFGCNIKQANITHNDNSSISEKIKNSKSIIDYDENTTIDQFDKIEFGSYYQNDVISTEKVFIEWIILDKDIKNKKALLLSKYLIDCKDYHETKDDITWENSFLRNWLNNEFYFNAFSDVEKEKILITKVINNNNSTYDTFGGNDTNDKIFCLSIDEVIKYFNQADMKKGNKRLATKGTMYAKGIDNNNEKMIVIEDIGYYAGQKFDFNEYKNDWYYGNSNYWLRSPGRTQADAARVSAEGVLNIEGKRVDTHCYGIRPAMWIKY